MTSPEQYAEWIVKNKDKKGTPQFEIVAKAYQMSKAQAQQPAPEPQQQSPEQASPESPSDQLFGGSASQNLTNLAGAAAEPLMTMGSGAVTMPLSGLAGILGSVLPGPQGQGQQWAEKIQSGTYQPKTTGGKNA